MNNTANAQGHSLTKSICHALGIKWKYLLPRKPLVTGATIKLSGRSGQGWCQLANCFS